LNAEVVLPMFVTLHVTSEIVPFSMSGFSMSGFSISGFSMSGLSTVRPARPPGTVTPPTAPSSLTSTAICARGSVEVA
jgi:hypothetical protein